MASYRGEEVSEPGTRQRGLFLGLRLLMGGLCFGSQVKQRFAMSGPRGACEECLFLLAEYLSEEEACSVIVALPPRPLTALTLTCNVQSGSKKARDRSQEKPRTRCRRRHHQVEVSVRWFDGLVFGSFGRIGLWDQIGRVLARCRMGKVRA